MTFLELAETIDTEKATQRAFEMDLAQKTTALASSTKAYKDQTQRVDNLMKEMQVMLGFTKPDIADVNMKELALQGQQFRGSMGKK